MNIIKTFAIAATLFLTTVSFKANDELKWMNFNDGYKLAKKTNKIMLVDVYTDWCGWCKRMDKDTYAQTEIINTINKDYVAIKFNPEIASMTYEYEGKTYRGQELAAVISENKLSGYPTTVFINPNNKKVFVQGGYFNASQFKPILDGIAVDLSSQKKSKK